MKPVPTLRKWRCFGSIALGTWISASGLAAGPNTLHFQGRVAVDGVPFTGDGQFKFALVDTAERIVWANAPDREPVDGAPDAAVKLAIRKGLYAVDLGEGMVPLPAEAFTDATGLRLRVWFDDGAHGFERLQPDQPLSAVPYARQAGAASTARMAEQVSGRIPVSQLQGALRDEQIPSTVARLDSSPVFGGTVTAVEFSGAGALRWRRVEGAETVAEKNEGILADRDGGPVAVVLPADARAGDVVRVSGIGAGGWLVKGLTEVSWVHQLADVRDGTGIACSGDGRRWLVSEGVHPSTGQGALWESKDGGSTWLSQLNGPNWLGVAMSRDGKRAVAWRGGVVPRNEIFGYPASFSSLVFPPLHTSALNEDGSLVVGAIDSGLQTYIYGQIIPRLRKSGYNWEAVATSASGDVLVAVDRPASAPGSVWISKDGGWTWEETAARGRWKGVALSSDGRRLIAVEDPGRAWTSVDGGATWTPRLLAGNWVATGMSADGQRIAVAQSGGGIWFSPDGGEAWQRTGPERNWRKLAMSSDGLRVGAIAAGDGIYLGDFTELNLHGSQGQEVEFKNLGSGRWSTVRPALLDPGSGQLGGAVIPSTLIGVRRFSGSVEVVPTSSTAASLSEAAPVGVVVDKVNPSMGYGVSLHAQDGAPVWKLGVGTDKDFSIGAAGKRDRDIAVDFEIGSVALGGQPVSNRKLMVYGDQESSGSVYAGGVRLTSDARLKQDVAPVDHALDKISSLRGVGFTWRRETPAAPSGTGRELGFLAQEVAAVLPDLVRTNEHGFLSLNYEGVTPVLVEALKELRQRYESDLARRDGEVRDLKERLRRLEGNRAEAEHAPWPAASAANP